MSVLFNVLKDTKCPDEFPSDVKITHSVASILKQWERLTTTEPRSEKRNESDPKEIEYFYLKHFDKVVVDDKENLTDANFIKMLKTLSKDEKIAVLCRCPQKARLFSYLAVRYGSISIASCSDNFHNNVTAMRSVVSETQVLIYDLTYFGNNPFSVNGRPDFVWDGSKFTIRPVQKELSSVLDPSVDVILKEEDSRHTRVLRGVRAPFLENEILVAEETVRLNSVDPSRTVAILYGSESPGKNAHAMAQLLCDLISKRKDLVVLGPPRSIDSVSDMSVLDNRNVVFVVSTAGVGEFPSGSKKFGETLFGESNKIDVNYESNLKTLSSLSVSFNPKSFAVFGLGDVNYHLSEKNKLDSYGTPWSYCTPAKILDRRFETLEGVERVVDLGFGGANTYKADFETWSAKLLHAYTPSSSKSSEQESKEKKDSLPQLHPIELYKMASRQLKQPLLNEMLDLKHSPDSISAAALQISKHHGIYQQRRRDELYEDPSKIPACSFMIRLRLPGGSVTPNQMTELLRIGKDFANHTIKITTRQTVQYHGVIKKDLIETINSMNRACLDTVAACGDVNRNVMCSVARSSCEDDELYETIRQVANSISEHLIPEGLARTWYDIWVARGRDYRATAKKDRFHIGNREITREAEKGADPEPVAGKAYLPRKFKIAIAIPPFNDPDVFAHCVGFIAIRDPKNSQKLLGFNVTAGGGMGTTKHGLYKAYARLANVIGFVETKDAKKVAMALMLIQRDYGVRTDRSHARFKYTVEDMGLKRLHAELKRRGVVLQPARSYEIRSNKDVFGVRVNEKTKTKDYTLYMQNGRIKDYPKQDQIPGRFSDVKLWTAFESVCEVLGESKSARIVFSNNQNVSITNVPRELTHRVESVLDSCNIKWKDPVQTYSPIMMNAMACVAFPTCGLAMAPAETYVPTLLSKLDTIMDELDFNRQGDRDIVLRMSGCPNGCSRPYVAEIALVGRSFSEERGGIYDLFLGGLPSGERLATRYRTGLDESEILRTMRPILKSWKSWRRNHPKACFGDFVVDTKIVDPCMAGPTYERINQRRPGVTFWPRKDSEVRKYLKVMYEENRDSIRDVVRGNYSDSIAREYERELSLEF